MFMETGVLVSLGNKIRHRREQAGMTPTDLARAIGLKREELLLAETGKKDISVLTLLKLLETFNVDYDTFMSDETVECTHIAEHSGIVEIHPTPPPPPQIKIY
ncbi:MAG: helix-turn-helix transcriptional regulator [Akkermansia sp.]|nr:helix-turn-helix transcriptional regulator [Akkermansia sp.]